MFYYERLSLRNHESTHSIYNSNQCLFAFIIIYCLQSGRRLLATFKLKNARSKRSRSTKKTQQVGEMLRFHNRNLVKDRRNAWRNRQRSNIFGCIYAFYFMVSVSHRTICLQEVYWVHIRNMGTGKLLNLSTIRILKCNRRHASEK